MEREKSHVLSQPALGSGLWKRRLSPALNISSPVTGLQRSPSTPGLLVLHPPLCHPSHALRMAILPKTHGLELEVLPAGAMQWAHRARSKRPATTVMGLSMSFIAEEAAQCSKLECKRRRAGDNRPSSLQNTLTSLCPLYGS